jgi:drug/metabolite transporter (DMT)-like permease
MEDEEMMENPPARSRLTVLAGVLIGLAGVIHILITPQHWAHAPAHGLLFAVVGVAEMAWAVVVWRHPSATAYRIGMVAAVGLVVLWAITRILPAPFGHGPESVEPFGVVCKLAEALGAIVLGVLVLRETAPNERRRPAWRVITQLVIVAFVAGFLSYGVARAAEPLLPSLGHLEEAHEDEHNPETAPTLTHEHEMTPTPTHEHNP